MVSEAPETKEEGMKLLTITATAVLLASMTLANAQNAPTTKVNPSPNSINKGSRATVPSGSESQGQANNTPARIIGKSKFCTVSSPGVLHCEFASMTACKKKAGNLDCVSRPVTGTVGKRP
jgi:hypothetical protein